jgi:hypothetical protein
VFHFLLFKRYATANNPAIGKTASKSDNGGVGDVLTRRLNRLPLPPIPLRDDMAQTWEGEMKAKHQGFLVCGPLEKSAPGGHNLLRSKVNHCTPIWMFHMNGMERRIGDAQ